MEEERNKFLMSALQGLWKLLYDFALQIFVEMRLLVEFLGCFIKEVWKASRCIFTVDGI